MIGQLAFRNLTYRPWRSVLLFFGFGVGVAVMIVLLSIGEALLSQARNEKLVGGGSIPVLPEGLDVEVMKTGGIGGLFFSIDHASFLYRQLFASPRFAKEVAAVAPQIEGRVLYIRTAEGKEYPVNASGEIPAATRAVGAAPEIIEGKWGNDDGGASTRDRPLSSSFGQRGRSRDVGRVALLQRVIAGWKAVGVHLVHRWRRCHQHQMGRTTGHHASPAGNGQRATGSR